MTKIDPSSTNVCLADFVFLALTLWKENDILQMLVIEQSSAERRE